MFEVLKNAVKGNAPFWVLTVFALLLIGVSFFLPPKGTVDPSVIAATGEIMGFFALWVLVRALEKGSRAKITHGQTSVTINDNKEEEEQ